MATGLSSGALTAKQISLLGAGAYKGFQDYFGDGGTANALKSAYWTEVTNGGTPGTVTIKNDVDDLPVYCEIASGADVADYAMIHTRNKYMVSHNIDDVTTVHLKFRARITVIDAGNVDFHLGLFDAEYAHSAVFISDAVTGIKYLSDDDTATEETDASGDIAQNTWYTFEIRITSSNIKFYVNNVLKATHSTRIPKEPVEVQFRALNLGAATNNEVQYVQLWVE